MQTDNNDIFGSRDKLSSSRAPLISPVRSTRKLKENIQIIRPLLLKITYTTNISTKTTLYFESMYWRYFHETNAPY